MYSGLSGYSPSWVADHVLWLKGEDLTADGGVHEAEGSGLLATCENDATHTDHTRYVHVGSGLIPRLCIPPER